MCVYGAVTARSPLRLFIYYFFPSILRDFLAALPLHPSHIIHQLSMYYLSCKEIMRVRNDVTKHSYVWLLIGTSVRACFELPGMPFRLAGKNTCMLKSKIAKLATSFFFVCDEVRCACSCHWNSSLFALSLLRAIKSIERTGWVCLAHDEVFKRQTNTHWNGWKKKRKH